MLTQLTGRDLLVANRVRARLVALLQASPYRINLDQLIEIINGLTPNYLQTMLILENEKGN